MAAANKVAGNLFQSAVNFASLVRLDPTTHRSLAIGAITIARTRIERANDLSKVTYLVSLRPITDLLASTKSVIALQGSQIIFHNRYELVCWHMKPDHVSNSLIVH